MITELAAKHGRSPAQICLRWAVQHDVVPIVKSLHPQRMRENLRIFDFSLTEDEMRRIDALPACGGPCTDSDRADY